MIMPRCLPTRELSHVGQMTIRGRVIHPRFWLANSQFTRFQYASMYFGRALR